MNSKGKDISTLRGGYIREIKMWLLAFHEEGIDGRRIIIEGQFKFINVLT